MINLLSAQCEQERLLGNQSTAFIVSLTESAAIRITADYGPDRFDRQVVDLDADGIDVATAGLEAGVLKPWPHDANGNALTAKPDWCNLCFLPLSSSPHPALSPMLTLSVCKTPAVAGVKEKKFKVRSWRGGNPHRRKHRRYRN